MLHRLAPLGPIAPLACTAALALAAPASAALVFSQDFSAGGTVADYESTPGTATTFDNIGQGGDATIEVVNDALVITGPSSASSATGHGGGFIRQDIAGATAPTLMTVQFHLTVSTGNQYQGNAGAFIVGDIAASHQTTYSTTFVPGGEATIAVSPAGGNYKIGFGGANTFVADGATSLFTLYLNNSGANQSYTDVNGQSRTLNDGAATLFVGDTLHAENTGVSPSDASAFSDIYFAGAFAEKSTPFSYAFDDIAVYDSLTIPEPASLALLGLGGLMMIPRRLRRRR